MRSLRQVQAASRGKSCSYISNPQTSASSSISSRSRISSRISLIPWLLPVASWPSSLPLPFAPCHPSRPSFCAKTHFSTMSAPRNWWQPPDSPSNDVSKHPDFTPKEIDPDNELPVEEEDLPSRRIHIMGTGSIGTLVAHALIQLPNAPPITLLMHKKEYHEEFVKRGGIIRHINKASDIIDEQTGFDVDSLTIAPRYGERSIWLHQRHKRSKHDNPSATDHLNESEKMESGEVFIYTLIVAVKGPATVSALRSVRHRVDQRTTILLMQNGLGQMDELNSKVFTDPTTRPTYMLGIISHGCHMGGPFTVIHAGIGSVALGIHRDTDRWPLPTENTDALTDPVDEKKQRLMYPSDADLYGNITARYLLRTMTRCPILACAAYPQLDLFQLQLEKLVTNCIINPMTAILDVKNGNMLGNPPLTRIQRLLIAEISLVLRGLPELQGIPNTRLRFSPSRLELRVENMALKTAENSSSMREDMHYMRETEIDYLNGYIVKRGEEQGIKCVLNYMIMQLIKAKNHERYFGHGQPQADGESAEPEEGFNKPKMVFTPLVEGGGVEIEDVSVPRR